MLLSRSAFLICLCAFSLRLFSASPNVSFGGIHLSLSPDSGQIALSCQGAIGVFDRSDGVLHLLTKGPGWDIQPVWMPSGGHILFSRSVDFRVGNLMRLEVASGEVGNLGVRVRGPIRMFPSGNKVLGHFSTTGYPNRIGYFDFNKREIASIDGLKEGHDVQIGDAFAITTSGETLVYAVHRDRPGEQTGNRGPQADLWQYVVSSGETKRLGQVPSMSGHKLLNKGVSWP
jgi:hypothetical protein